MSLIKTLENIAKGAVTGVVVITALPIFGVVGTITATGIAVGSVLGGAAGLIDSKKKDD